ncbi:MAG TPA: hypothetical protein VFE51_08820 [Verrucomicrobiae bacterium]|nr:hypothetical protein [Verrucomicrobiae bacterium]
MRSLTPRCVLVIVPRLLASLTAAAILRAQSPFAYPVVPEVSPPTTPTAQRHALSVVRSEVNWLRNACRTASNFTTGNYDLILHQFQKTREAYAAFKATLTPDQLNSVANELAELDAGLDLLQEAFAEYQTDVSAGRTRNAAFQSMCHVLDKAAGLWLEELNKLAKRLRL